MPKQNNNIVMRSTRGMLGKQVVFKRRGGKSYVSAPPEVNGDRVPTDKQLAVQKQFKASTIYAAAAIKDDDVKKAYLAVAKRGQSAYNVAFVDAFDAPQVLNIITQGYQGLAGNVIVIQATDDFKVKEVKVSIHNSANELVEEGSAVAGVDGLNWTYAVLQANASIAGSKIKATAFDLPGNQGSLEVTL